MTDAQDHFKQGDLAAAIEAATAVVKKAPADVAARLKLADYLMFAGDLDRADKQLDIVSTQDPTWGPKAAMIRQLLRAATARQDFFTAGRPPEFVTAPSEAMTLALKASVALRAGDAAEAASLLAQAEAARKPLAGAEDDAPFDDFRDLDDLTAGIFEVLTTNGKYFWVPAEQVRSLAFAPPEHLRDLIWRQAEIDVKDGPQGVVYIPALYSGDPAALDDAAKLGRRSDWEGEADGLARGVGLRCYLVGDDIKPISEIGTLTFDMAE